MNYTALIVHSPHTFDYGLVLSRQFSKATFLEVTETPKKRPSKSKVKKDFIIGVGGGSVIDTAKILAGKSKCIAIPTTASGSAMTPFATIWKKNKKNSVITKTPIFEPYHGVIRLPYKVAMNTFFDALSHTIEALLSKNATKESTYYAYTALKWIGKYKYTAETIDLIEAGNYAGRAIAITKTNVVHALSYVLTTEYGMNHGAACGLLLPYIMDYLNSPCLGEFFYCKLGVKLIKEIRDSFYPQMLASVPENLNAKDIIVKVRKYEEMNDSIVKVNEKRLMRCLTKMIKENK